MTPNKWTPSVVAPLEEWDNTTDAIVWLIEQKTELQISQYADLLLEQLPEQYHGSRRFETLESQSAQFEGYLGVKGKVRLDFTAEYKDDIEDPETNLQVEGYLVTVHRRFLADFKGKAALFAIYHIIGTDRSDFQIVGEKVEA